MTKKILVVDDELDFIELLRYRLPAPEFIVLFATNGTDALNQIWHHSPDVILVDLMLPDLDGLTLCEILRRQNSTRQIPVIMVSALSNDVTRYSAEVAGAREFLAKPLDFERLKVLLADLTIQSRN
jgi:two-component system alkaline phosphatase synthesis response regulator PhoP